MTAIAINRETISGTYNRLRQHIRRTPLLSVSPTDFGSDAAELHLKLECLQHSGSFKARGAFTHFLLGSIPDAGVVAASGGNHGAAVAFAAAHFNSLASIFVPEISAPAKQEAIQKTGARLVVGGARYAEALSAVSLTRPQRAMLLALSLAEADGLPEVKLAFAGSYKSAASAIRTLGTVGRMIDGYLSSETGAAATSTTADGNALIAYRALSDQDETPQNWVMHPELCAAVRTAL